MCCTTQLTKNLYDTSFTLLSYSKDATDPTPNLVVVDTTKLTPNTIRQHPTQDISVVKLCDFANNNTSVVVLAPGFTNRSTSKIGFLSVSMEAVKKYDDVMIGNDVILLGYPTSLALKAMAQIDPVRPLLRKGIVAGENPLNPLDHP